MISDGLRLHQTQLGLVQSQNVLHHFAVEKHVCWKWCERGSEVYLLSFGGCVRGVAQSAARCVETQTPSKHGSLCTRGNKAQRGQPAVSAATGTPVRGRPSQLYFLYVQTLIHISMQVLPLCIDDNKDGKAIFGWNQNEMSYLRFSFTTHFHP